MVDFKETEMRKKCRNPKCRMKLSTPTSNEREAFCCRGCHQSFYLHRCLVCEDKIERTTANRKICKKSKCRNALAAGEGFGRYHADPAKTSPGIQKSRAHAETPYFMRVRERLRHRRPAQYSLRAATLAYGGRDPDLEPVPLRRGWGRSGPERRLAGYPICAGMGRWRLAGHGEQEPEASREAHREAGR
jgi:hypothetical protein